MGNAHEVYPRTELTFETRWKTCRRTGNFIMIESQLPDAGNVTIMHYLQIAGSGPRREFTRRMIKVKLATRPAYHPVPLFKPDAAIMLSHNYKRFRPRRADNPE